MTNKDCTDSRESNQHCESYKCTQCGKTKADSLFHKDKRKSNGLKSICSNCHKENFIAYKKTKQGLVSTIYSRQKDNSKKRGHPLPSYSKKELLLWCFNQDVFHRLHKEWVGSGCDTWRVPSIDRINDAKPYSFDNIQIMTWMENHKKGCAYSARKQNSRSKRAVKQYSVKCGFIAEYESTRQASRATGVAQQAISKVCRGERISTGYKKDGTPKYVNPKTAGGYFWAFSL